MGGVFFNLFKAAVGEDEYIYAFEEFKERQKQKKILEWEVLKLLIIIIFLPDIISCYYIIVDIMLYIYQYYYNVK